MAYGDDYEDDILAPPPPPAPAAAPGAPGASPAPDPTVAAAAGGGGGKNKGGGGPPERPVFNFAGLPGFVAPKFNAPTVESALSEPGYALRLQAGQQALERSAAARGVLRSGGTLQGLTEYGQKFGQQEYANVFNRALQQYDRTYQGAKDTYAPQLARWQTLANAEIQAGLAAYNRNRGGGGGGGGGGLPPLDVLLGPPPVMPDYAQMQSPGLYAPQSGIVGGGGAAPSDYEDDPWAAY